jgi:WD40 repeat protein
LAVSSTGHYRGGLWIEREIVYVVKTDGGQETLSPEEFAKKYGWKNNPERARPPIGHIAESKPPEKPAPKIPTGEPLSPLALITEPARINGIQSWTIETVGHRGAVRCLAYSPDGRWLAIGGEDGTIRLRDAVNNQLVRVFVASGKEIISLHWSPDGKAVATASSDGMVRLWEPESGKLLRRVTVNAGDDRVGWSPDGKVLAIGGNGPLIKLVEMESGQIRAIHGATGGNNLPLAWSPNGQRIATGTHDSTFGIVQIREVPSGKLLCSLEPYKNAIQAIAWSPDGKTIAVGGNWSNAGLFDADTGKRRVTTGYQGGVVFQLAWSPDSKILASGGSDGTARLWDPKTGKQLHVLKHGGFPQWRRTLAWSPKGKTLATSDGLTVRIWEAKTGKPLHTIKGAPAFGADGIACSPDGKMLATTSARDKVHVWDIAAGQHLRTLDDDSEFVSWSPNSESLIASSTHFLHRWDVKSGKLYHLNGHASPVHAAVWAPDGKRLCSLTSKDAIIWDTTTSKNLSQFNLPKDTGNPALWWAKDSQRLNVAGPQVWVYDPTAGKLERTLDVRPAVANAWALDGNILARGGEQGFVWLWDRTLAKDKKTLGNHRQRVRALAWAPDGKTLASASVDNTVRVWDIEGKKLPRVIEGTDGKALAWSADNTTLITIHKRLISILDATSGELRGTMMLLPNNKSIPLSPAGYYRGSGLVEQEIVYVVQTDRGQKTFTPEEFEKKYRWKNNPEQVRLGGDPGKNDVIKPAEPWAKPSFLEITPPRGKDQEHEEKWLVTYNNGGKRTYIFVRDEVLFVEENRRTRLMTMGKDTLLDFADGKLEKVKRVGDELQIEHFDPAGSYPGKPKLLAIGLKQAGPGMLAPLVSRPAPIKGVRSWTIVTRGHVNRVMATSFSPDGSVLATGGDDGTIRLWNPQNGELIRGLVGPGAVDLGGLSWSPDGKYLLSTCSKWDGTTEDGATQVWNAKSGQLLHTIKGGHCPGLVTRWQIPSIRRREGPATVGPQLGQVNT